MSYIPNVWSSNDVVTAERMNHIEDGIASLQVAPLALTIPASQWSQESDYYYVTINASNVTANSILVPNYDKTGLDNLAGPIWCVPSTGSFTLRTSALPRGEVNVLIQFPGVMGEANYQVLADVYSTSQAVAKADIINNLTSTATDKPLSAAQGKVLNEYMVPVVIDNSFTDKDSHIDGFHARRSGNTVTLSFGLKSGVTNDTTLFNIPSDLTPVFVYTLSPLIIDSSGAVYTNGSVWITLSNRNRVAYYGSTTTAYSVCVLTYMVL